MPINCSAHHDKPATFICRECGFLCQEHAESEGEKSHTALFVNAKMKELYSEMALLEKASELNSYLLMLKKEVANAIDDNAYKLFCQIDAHKAKVAILTYDKSIAGVNQIGKFIKESFKFDTSINVSDEINQLCESIKSAIEKSFEQSKSFMKNDLFLTVSNDDIGKCSEAISIINDIEAIITQCIPNNDCTIASMI